MKQIQHEYTVHLNTIDRIIDTRWVFCRSTNVPCISPSTRSFLTDIINTYQPKRILEIGSAYGYSLWYMWSLIHQWWWVIVWSERAYPNRAYINILLSLCIYYGLDNIHCLYQPFLQISPSILASHAHSWFDMVFVDAQKSEYLLYVDYLYRHHLVSSKTLWVFDDVIMYQEKVEWLITCLQTHDLDYQIIPLEKNDWVLVAHTPGVYTIWSQSYNQ